MWTHEQSLPPRGRWHEPLRVTEGACESAKSAWTMTFSPSPSPACAGAPSRREPLICAYLEHNPTPNLCEDFGLFSEQGGGKSADRRQRENFEENAGWNSAFVKKALVYGLFCKSNLILAFIDTHLCSHKLCSVTHKSKFAKRIKNQNRTELL